VHTGRGPPVQGRHRRALRPRCPADHGRPSRTSRVPRDRVRGRAYTGTPAAPRTGRTPDTYGPGTPDTRARDSARRTRGRRAEGARRPCAGSDPDHAARGHRNLTGLVRPFIRHPPCRDRRRFCRPRRKSENVRGHRATERTHPATILRRTASPLGATRLLCPNFLDGKPGSHMPAENAPMFEIESRPARKSLEYDSTNTDFRHFQHSGRPAPCRNCCRGKGYSGLRRLSGNSPTPARPPPRPPALPAMHPGASTDCL
jgi:hypothetical protein